jgi:YggT family protein
MTPYFAQAAIYLIQVVFGFYILIVLLRFLFQLARADFYNPISQFLVTLSNPPLRLLRRLIPGLWGIDLASVVLLIALKTLEIWLIAWIREFSGAFAGIIVLAAAQLFELTIYVYIVTVLIRVVMSWFSPQGMRRHPLSDLLYSLTEPLLRPARRLIPPISGIDFSPIAVFVLLQLTLILMIRPLNDLGVAIMMR